MFAFEKLHGLSRSRVVDAIEPVLSAHGVVGVELIWKMDEGGRVLQVTLERPRDAAGALLPAQSPPSDIAEEASGEVTSSDASATVDDKADDDKADDEAGGRAAVGVTLAVCSKVSRDLSTALDVSGAIDGKYRLEVGTPGLERRLYTAVDYARFAGQRAKLKLASPLAGQHVVVGKLLGLDSEGRVLVEAESVEHAIDLQQVKVGQLVIDWQKMGFAPATSKTSGRRSSSQQTKALGRR
jgi:ribosome maturation factor RimP